MMYVLAMTNRHPVHAKLAFAADITAAGALIVVDDALVDRMQEFLTLAVGAYSANTLRAWRADFRQFSQWCTDRGYTALPATAATVRRYVQYGPVRLISTVRRHVSTIGALHRGLQLPDPTDDSDVKLALRGLAIAITVAPRQAHALTWPLREALVAACGPSPAGRRDAALIACLYDGVFRRSEVVALQREDLTVAEDGATIRLRRSKTDRVGAGTEVYLGPDTAGLVLDWCDAAGITDGPLFRPVNRWGAVGMDALTPDTVARILKARAIAGQVPAAVTVRLSGHSGRVGATHDMVAAGIELPQVMQAGRWKSPAMVARYAEKVLARRGGVAQLAVKQGRIEK